jgi:hypothetical protein
LLPVRDYSFWRSIRLKGIYPVDDGDGQHVLPITIRLPLIPSSSLTSKARADPLQNETTVSFSSSRTFRTSKERKLNPRSTTASTSNTNTKTYARKDIRVGDTVRVVGRIEEWARRKASGGLEWVRGVGADQGQGGSIG